jgi:hypothetical protein
MTGTLSSNTNSILVSLGDWRKRQPDRQFNTLAEMEEYATTVRETTAEVKYDYDKMVLGFDGVAEGGDLWLNHPSGGPVAFSNYSFGQLARTIGVPVNVLRDKMSAPLAAMTLQYNLEKAVNAGKSGKVFLTPPVGADQPGLLHAYTSEAYGRIYDNDVLARFRAVVEENGWVPAGYTTGGLRAGQDPNQKLLYVSPQNSFAFVTRTEVDEVAGRPMRHGLIAVNSQVGERSLQFRRFTFDEVCSNLMIYSVGDEERYLLRHTRNAPQRFLDEALPKLKDMVLTGGEKLGRAMEAARGRVVIDRKPGMSDGQERSAFVAWMTDRGFTKGDAEFAVTFQAGQEGSSAPTLFNAVGGLTAAARGRQHADAKVDISTRATNLLASVWPSS